MGRVAVWLDHRVPPREAAAWDDCEGARTNSQVYVRVSLLLPKRKKCIRRFIISIGVNQEKVNR